MNFLKSRWRNSIPADHFALYGERCSGTNILSTNIVLNSRKSFVESCPVGGKHFPPVVTENERETLESTRIVVVVRGAVEWLRSLYAKPWHAAPEIRTLSFSDFIRKEWYSVLDEHANIPKGEKFYGSELMADRDPITGGRFASVLHMRTRKLTLLEHLAGLSPRSTVVRFEDYVSSPTASMEKVMLDLQIPFSPPIKISPYYKGRASWRRKLLIRAGIGWLLPPSETSRPKPKVSEEDEDYIWSVLDSELESRFGYYPPSKTAPSVSSSSLGD